MAREILKYCKATGTMLPLEEARQKDYEEPRRRVRADDLPDMTTLGAKTGLYRYCKTTREVMRADEARRIDHEAEQTRLAKHAFVSDELGQYVRNPVNGKYSSSAGYHRKVYASAGVTEIGDAYERGYDPEKESAARMEAEASRKFKEAFPHHLNAGAEFTKERMDLIRRNTEAARERKEAREKAARYR